MSLFKTGAVRKALAGIINVLAEAGIGHVEEVRHGSFQPTETPDFSREPPAMIDRLHRPGLLDALRDVAVEQNIDPDMLAYAFANYLLGNPVPIITLGASDKIYAMAQSGLFGQLASKFDLQVMPVRATEQQLGM